jgi:uncharacterized surface anchored protein
MAAAPNADGTSTLLWSKNALKGAVFGIFAEEDITTPDGSVQYAAGERVDTLTTDADGKAQSVPLYLGKYEVREQTAPQGYVLDTAKYEVVLTYAGQAVELTETAIALENARQKVAVALEKVMLQDERKLVTGKLSRVTFGLYAAEDLVAATLYVQPGGAPIAVSGTVPAGTLLAVTSVAEDGTAEFDAELPFGKYYVREIATDDGFILDNTQYPVTFEYAGQDVATVKIALNDGKAIENKPILGGITLTKVDAENPETKLSGAEFTVFGSRIGTDNKPEFYEIAKMTETEPGVYKVSDLPMGAYYVQETRAPEGYLRDAGYYLVTVAEAKQYVVSNAAGGLFTNEPGTPPPDTAVQDISGYVALIGLGAAGIAAAVVMPMAQRRRRAVADGDGAVTAASVSDKLRGIATRGVTAVRGLYAKITLSLRKK